MNIYKTLPTFLFFVLLIIQTSFAANRFWVASVASNWNNTANWSTASGGAGGASVPGIADIAILDGGGLGNATLDININVVGLTVASGYTGTISQGASTVSVGSSGASFSGGAFIGGAANITVSGNFTISGTAAFTSTSGVLSLKGDYTFSGGTFNDNGGSVLFNAGFTPTISGSTTFNNIEISVNPSFSTSAYEISSGTILTVIGDLLISAGTKRLLLNTGTIDAQGDIAITNTSTDTAAGGSATIHINGTGNQTLTGSGVVAAGKLPNITINKPSGTLFLASDITLGRFTTWQFVQGNIDASTFSSNLVQTRNSVISGSHTLFNVEYFPIGSVGFEIATGTELTVEGTLKMSGLPNTSVFVNNGIINVKGDILIASTGSGSTGGSNTIKINGATDQTITGNVTPGVGKLPNIVIDKTSGTLFFVNTISVGGNWTYVQGNVDATTNNSTVVFTSVFFLSPFDIDGQGTSTTMTFNNVTFFSASSSSNLTGTLDVDGDLLINTSVTELDAGTQDIFVAGNWINNGTFTGGTGTIIFDGNTTISGTSTTSFNNITIASSSSLTASVNNINVAGNWDNSGTFANSNGTVTFNGATSQSITKATGIETFFDLTVNNTGAGLSLLSPVDVENILTLTDGVINTTANNILTLKDNATTTGATDASFVEGPITKEGDDPFTFPVGKNSNFQPLSISAPAIVTDAFTTEYFDIEPIFGQFLDPNLNLFFGYALDEGLRSRSGCEHWNLDRISGTSSVLVTLNWNQNSCDINQLADLRVTSYDGANKWINQGNGAITGTQNNGTIRSNNPINVFGALAIGNSLPLFQFLPQPCNLVCNGDFETGGTPCPLGSLPSATPWFQNQAAEYHTTGSTVGCDSHAPDNFAGAQAPLSGSGYIGLVTFVNTMSDAREYAMQDLNACDAPLISGKCYWAEMQVSVSNDGCYPIGCAGNCNWTSGIAVDGMGMVFTPGNINNFAFDVIVPTGTFDIVENQAGNILNDPLNWVEISGSFVAQADYNFITIGNFRNDASTQTQALNPIGFCAGSNLHYSYYYIEDVSVIEVIADAGIDRRICIGESTVLGNMDCPITQVSYSWSPAGTLDDPSIPNPTATPVATTTYILTVTTPDGNCVLVDDVIVEIGLPFTVSTTDVTCNGGSDGTATVTVTGGIFPFNYQWNDPSTQSTATAIGLQPGTFNVIVTDVNGCTANENVTINEPSAITTSIVSTDASCGLNDGTATVTISGGTPDPCAFPGGQVSYTPTSNVNTFFNRPPPQDLFFINDNIFGLTFDGTIWSASSPFTLTMTFDCPVVLTEVKIVFGQFNGTFNIPVSMTLHRGTITDPIILGPFVPPNDQNLNSFPFVNSQASTVYTWEITPSAFNFAAIQEIQCFAEPIPPYIIQWDDPFAQTTETAADLPADAYTVTITDANGCQAIDNVIIAELCSCDVMIHMAGLYPSNPPFQCDCDGPCGVGATLCPGDYIFYAIFANMSATVPVVTGSTLEFVVPPFLMITSIVDLCTSVQKTLISPPNTSPVQYLVTDVNGIPPQSNCMIQVFGTITNFPTCLWNISSSISGPNCNFQTTQIFGDCNVAGGPLDPNHKQVIPVGCGDPGFITNQDLTYILSFQNVGTGPANNVVLRDTIDDDLDLNSIQILSSIHPITSVQISQPDRELVITFQGIGLPPLVVDTQASIGAVKYKISPLPGLANGTSIENSTGIFFDNVPAVITNTVINTIVDDPVVAVDAGIDQTVFLGYPPEECADLSATASGAIAPYDFLWSTGETTQDITVCPSVTSNFTVVADASGCFSEPDTLTIEVIDVQCGNNSNKVLICHIPPGNPANAHEICISANAVPAHLTNHGDHLGPCVDSSFVDSSNFKVQSSGILLSSFPNPFSQKTTIIFSVPEKGNVKLEIPSLTSHKAVKLFEGYAEENILYSVVFDASVVSGGIYFCRLITETGTETKKLIVIK